MQTSVRVLASAVLAVGCTGFEARNYDAPIPPHGAGGGAGYSYQAGNGGAGATAMPRAPRDQEGDWGPSGAGSVATLGEGGTSEADAHPPVTHHERASGGSGQGVGTLPGAGGESGEHGDDGGQGGDDGRSGYGGHVSAAGGANGAGHAGVTAGGRGGRAGAGGNAAGTGGRAGSAGQGGRDGAGGVAGGDLSTAGHAGATAGNGSTPSVIFSEYVEGSSRYKALELRALAPSALDGCRIATYSNGGSTAKSFALSGALGADSTLVVCSPELSELLGSVCTVSASLSFNGNDALALECGDVTLDVIGQVGVDPGEAWTSGDASTANHTLRRRCAVTQGDAVGTDTFELGLEWAAFPSDDFSGLGVPDCG